MAQVQRLPDPTTWRFVLVHNFVRHGIPLKVGNYRGTATSFLSLHHGEAKPTLCISDVFLRDRLLRIGGWTEITHEVGPATVKSWDEERGRWRFDPEGLLPWERKPGERLAPLPTEEEEKDAAPVEEVEIEGGEPRPQVKREVRGAAAVSQRKREEGLKPAEPAAPAGGKGSAGPSSRPR